MSFTHVWTESCIQEAVIFEPPLLVCSLASDLSPPTRILIVAVEPRLYDVLFEFLDGTNTWGQIHKGTHNAHSTCPGLDCLVIAQSSHAKRRLRAEEALLERTKPASDVS